MRSIKENIAANISALRKNSGMSQAELAEKLHYSDKAISKWERGESTPDVDSLNEIAIIFGVSVEYLFKEHDEKEIKNKAKTEKEIKNKRIAVFALLCTAIWFFCIIIFIYAYTAPNADPHKYFLPIIWATPISALFALFFGVKYKMTGWSFLAASVLLWTGLGATFGTVFLLNNTIMWYFFFAGVPIQAAICLGYYLIK